ncbi:MAG: hypothetical protein KGO53_14050 [Alphaproteobacteria bacterium]|nr:hypothetical protein [Alphaproteobacteria bacterium]
MSDKFTGLTDQELDRLLAKASTPQLHAGFESRMAARIAQTAANNVVPFPQRKAPAPSRATRLPLAAALAASLVLGVWFGSSGQGLTLFESTAETAMLTSGNDFAPTGMEELGNLDADTQS